MKTITHLLHSRSLTLAVASLAVTADLAQALPVDRAVGRAGARYSRTDGRQDARYERRQGDYAEAREERIEGRTGARVSRTAGRVVSRSRYRGCYALPRGAVVVPYGGYRYYRVGSAWYYPYMHAGRTVYIDVQVVNGMPVAPPPANSIDIDIYVR